MVAIMSENISKNEKKRIFSINQANRTLPLVQRIVADILQAWRKVRDYQEQYESLQDRDDSPHAESTMIELTKAREFYQEFCQELSSLGCRLSDEVSGTVEFPAVVNDKQVILSWRMGESEVTHWHDPGQDSHERKLLAELNG